MLLQTLSRQHVGATLLLAQVVGVAVVMGAKRLYPFVNSDASPVFPNVAFLDTEAAPLSSWTFCASAQFCLDRAETGAGTCMLMQALSPLGFFLCVQSVGSVQPILTPTRSFYRTETLSRP